MASPSVKITRTLCKIMNVMMQLSKNTKKSVKMSTFLPMNNKQAINSKKQFFKKHKVKTQITNNT